MGDKIEAIMLFIFGKKEHGRFFKVLIFVLVLIVGAYFLFVFRWERISPKGKMGGDPIHIDKK